MSYAVSKIAALFAAICAPVAALGAEPLAIAPLTVVYGDMKSVEVVVGGAPFTFILDTGSGVTGFGDAAAAAAGCTPFGEMTGFRMSGEKASAPWCGVQRVDISGTVAEKMVMSFDVGSLLPPDWPKVDGILSLTAFEGVPITLDWAAGRLILESAESLAARTEGLQPAPLHLQREIAGYGLSVFIEVDARPAPLRVLLDSGNVGGSILAPHAFVQLGLNPLATDGGDNPETAAIDLTVAGSPVKALTVQAADIIYDGNFGAAFLNRHVVTLDISTRRIWIAPN